MSKSTHQFEVKGVDKSAGAFGSIKNRAAATSAQIRSMVGGAIAAAGAYLSFRAIKGGIDELGYLSDVAQKTSTSVDELTKTATALEILGIQNMGVQQLGKAFDYMAKTTGRTGMEGFYQTIAELGKIPDASKRAEMSMKVFGKSGMEFMPLVNAAKDGTAAFRSVVDAMPAVSQAAAGMGDELSDAEKIGAAGFKSIWLKALGAVCSQFGVDFRGGASAMVAYVDYGVSVAWRYLKSLFDKNDEGVRRFETAWKTVGFGIVRSVVTISAVCFEYIKTIPERLLAGFAGGIMGIPGIFSKSYRESHDQKMKEWVSGISQEMWMEVDKDLKALGIDIVKDSLKVELQGLFSDVKIDDLEEKLEKMLKLAARLRENVGNAAMSSGVRNKNDTELKELDNVRKARILNDLVLGGSNAALKMQLLGPTYQSDTKKMVSILQKIEQNTEKTADNTEESGETMNVIDR